jgi:endonuclease-3
MKHAQAVEQQRAVVIIQKLREATKNMVQPAAQLVVGEYGRDPYLVLVSCILSLRTKDNVSWPASRRLFAYAKTPSQMLALSAQVIQKLIYPCGFYRQKAATILSLSADLIERFDGIVPSDFDQLMSIKGVGPKTANLVRGKGFGIPALCVDVHVHRISNRLGLIATTTVAETLQALQEVIPQEYWIEYNELIVMWGQNICVPISPRCSICPIRPWCDQVGVTRSR